MFFKVDITLSLAISLFIFYLSAEAFDSNDVTDGDGGKRDGKGDSWKKTYASGTTQHGKDIPTFSTARFHSEMNVINKETVVPTSANAKSGTVSRPNMSSRIAPSALTTVATGLRHNEATRISDLTVNQPLLVGVTKSYSTVVRTSKLSQHTGLVQSISSMTSFSRASAVGNLHNGVSPTVKSNGLLTLASQNREKGTSGYFLHNLVVKPSVPASFDRSNISSTKATYSRHFSRTPKGAIANSDSSSMIFTYLTPTTSIYMSALATPHPGHIGNLVNKVLEVANSSKINQNSLTSPSSSFVDSRKTLTISLNSGSRVFDLQDKLHSADSQAIITPSFPFSEIDKIQTMEIRSSIQINDRSVSYSEIGTPDLKINMNSTTESRYRASSPVSKHNLIENGNTAVSVRPGVKGLKPTRSMSDVNRTSFRVKTFSSSNSAIPSLNLNNQKSVPFTQLESPILGPATALTTSSISPNAAGSLSSLRERHSVINITHALAFATPVSIQGVASSLLNETKVFMLSIATDVGTESSLGVTTTLVEPSYGLSQSLLQQNKSFHAVLTTPPVLSTPFNTKGFFATPVSSRSSFSRSKTKSMLLDTPSGTLASTRSHGTMSTAHAYSSSIPTFNSTRQRISTSVAVVSSVYISQSHASNKTTGVSSGVLTTDRDVLPISSMPLLTTARFSKTKRIFTTSSSKADPTRMTSNTTATTTPATTIRSTQKERPATEPRVTSQPPIYIGEPKVHTKLIAKYVSALNIEFDVSFPGISEAYRMQIIAQKYDHRAIADKSSRLRTWYEVHYFEDHKHEPYIVYEFTKKHTVKRRTFNFTIGSDVQCEVKQVRFKYCNGPLHKGTYRFRLFYHVHGKIKKSAFSKVYATATATVPGGESSTLNQNSITIAVIAVLAVLLVIIVVIAVVLYKRKNSNRDDDFGDTEVSDCTLLTSLKRNSSCSKSCYGRGALGTADSSVVLKSLTKAMARPVHVKDFIAWVTRSQADSDFRFAEEFESIRDVGRDQSHEASDIPENRGKNRYVNVLAYDRTRVKLSYTDDEVGSDYINANYIHGYNHPRAYIATQGPLPGTTDDFWRMIWEQNTYVIVMATQCVERNRVKCHQYWPGIQPTAFGDIVVSLLSENAYPEWIEREFLLEVEEEESRRIHHFQYVAWPDHGVPKNAATTLEFIHTVRSHVIPDQGPIVVHCSAGVGRTGTLIAIDTILDRLQEEDTIDVYLCVCFMRTQRCSMVQTEEQYIFIHRVLVEYLKSRNTASLLKGYSLLPKDDDENDLESEGCPSINRDSGLALLLSEYDTEHVEEALESIA